jgi:hypothetical protein
MTTNSIYDQLEIVRQLVVLKHQAGRHDQGKHDPHKGRHNPYPSGAEIVASYGDLADNTSADHTGKGYYVTPDDELMDMKDAYHIDALSDHEAGSLLGLSDDDIERNIAALENKDWPVLRESFAKAQELGNVRVRESSREVAIHTQNMDTRTLKRLQHLYDIDKIDVDPKRSVVWESGAGDDSMSFETIDFLSAKSVVDLKRRSMFKELLAPPYLYDQLEIVRQLVVLKHQAGRHDQSRHDPHKGRGGAPAVTPDRAMLAKFTGGQLNSRLYHITDSERVMGIAEQGLVPGKENPLGQTWQAEHAGYATYFHSSADAATADADRFGELAGVKPPMVIADIPPTKEYAKRILPDEDVDLDVNRGLQALAGGDPVAVIGGAGKDVIWGFRVDEYDTAVDVERLMDLGYEVELY